MTDTYSVPALGRLQVVDLREVWPSEPYSFTPWLAQPENLQFLAESLGLPGLELVATERQVDVFSADIVAKRSDTGEMVLIENQIERSDHTHLGQILTYAAGVEATLIVWIARRFTEGHRAALDWLNHATREEFSFFGIEVEALRIGDSAPAPRFNVISRPNAWSRQLKTASTTVDISADTQSHTNFWLGYEKVAREIGAPVRISSKQVTSTNYYVTIPEAKGTYLAAYRALSSKRLGVYVTLQGPEAEARFRVLEARKETIEAAFGGKLEWIVPKTGSAYQIGAGSLEASPNEADWPRQQLWLAERMKKLHTIILPELASLAADMNVREDGA